MFNPNGTFKLSVDLATIIYSNPEANTTWEYIYPQICKYMEERGKAYSLKELGDKKVISVDRFDITVMPVQDSIVLSFMAVFPLGKQILDEAYDNKTLFGLPVASTMMMEGFTKSAIITFMSRETWEALNTPQAREMERMFNNIDRFWGVISDDNDSRF